MIRAILITVATTVVMSGCASPNGGSDPYARTNDPYSRAPSPSEEVTEEAQFERNENTISAYEQALEQILLDFRGKMQASEGAVFSAPVQQCNVWIPEQRAGHAVYPSHKGCVTIAPGYYSQDRPVFLPVRPEGDR